MKAIDCPFTKIITHALQRVRAGDGPGQQSRSYPAQDEMTQ